MTLAHAAKLPANPYNSLMKRLLPSAPALLCVALVSLWLPFALLAQQPTPQPSASILPVPAAPTISARSYLLIDFHSGKILAEREPDMVLEPASITKLMTSYVVFHELRKGDLKLSDKALISEKAWRMGGSKMFIKVDTEVTIEDLLKGMIVQSGNDASVALAEHIAGSEEVFASMMNHYASELGMDNSYFENATGWPGENHVTTARDISLLSAALIREFPDLYAWYADKKFSYNDIEQPNRNTLLWRDPTVDGLKTGHTDAAGYCLAASAKRDNMRLISVVMGANSEKSRADDSQKLLTYGFRFFETHRLYQAGTEIRQTRIWKGNSEQVGVGLVDDLFVTIPRGRYDQLEARMDILSVITAPLAAQTELGRLNVLLDGESQATATLHALSDVDRGGLWRRLSDSVALWFSNVGN